MEEQVGSVQQALALRNDRSLNRGMRVTESRHANAAQQVQIYIALLVAQKDAIAIDEENRVAFVRVQQQLLLRCLYRFEL